MVLFALSGYTVRGATEMNFPFQADSPLKVGHSGVTSVCGLGNWILSDSRTAARRRNCFQFRKAHQLFHLEQQGKYQQTKCSNFNGIFDALTEWLQKVDVSWQRFWGGVAKRKLNRNNPIKPILSSVEVIITTVF